MATTVSICSNALLMLGDTTINALNEGTPRARLASNLYDSTRDDLLRSHPWNSAVKRVILAPDAEVPAFDYSNQFTLPGDWLRNLSVGPEGYEVDYKTENGKLLANGTSLSLRYIYRNDNESTWDAMLVRAMQLKMAAVMAYGITKSASMVETTSKLLEMHMRLARSVDAQDDPSQMLGDERLLNSRFGSVRR